jgi:MFS family permease
VGGFVVLKKGWRWTQWIILILTAIIYVPSLFRKETYKKVILTRRARKVSTTGISGRARFGAMPKVSLTATCIRPLHMLATEPVVLPLSIYQFLVVANLYTLNAAVPYIFLAIYRFNSGEQGLAYISFGIGFTLGLAILICVAQHKIRKARAASAKGVRVKASAEARLQPTRMGGLVPPLGIFWCGGSLASPCSLDWPNGRNGCLSPGRWI